MQFNVVTQDVACDGWSGTCPPGQQGKKDEGRCVNALSDLPPGEEVPLCADMCCHYPTCFQKVSCPAGYRLNTLRQCSAVDAQNRDGVRYCSQQTCCDTTCGGAVTCPANMDSQKELVCSAKPDSPRQCDVTTCCVSTCGSSFTCPTNYNSNTAASVECTSASDAKGGRSSVTLAAVCTTDLCCRTSCKSNAHKCPAGSGYGKLEFRVCQKAGGAMGFESKLPVCSDTVCCEVINKCPADFVCDANTKQRADVTKVNCFGICAADDCCVDVPVTCAAAASKCTGSTLKVTPDKIVCGLSAIAPAADACSLDKCCSDAPCADNAACRADGDSAAICQNGTCLCTLLYASKKKSCAFNRLFFVVTFTDGNYSKLTAAHRVAVSVALSKKLTKLRALGFSQGSISPGLVISGDAETLFGSVSDTEIVDAIKTAVPASVLGSKVQTTLSKVKISNVCKSADPGAVAAVKVPFASGEVCVPTFCNLAKGYTFRPVAHKCVLRAHSSDGLTTEQKVGIAFGVIGFIAIVVGVVLVVLKGRSSGAAPTELEPATNTQMKELPSASTRA